MSDSDASWWYAGNRIKADWMDWEKWSGWKDVEERVTWLKLKGNKQEPA